jgi:hypothetical protein
VDKFNDITGLGDVGGKPLTENYATIKAVEMRFGQSEISKRIGRDFSEKAYKNRVSDTRRRMPMPGFLFVLVMIS